MKPHFTDTPLDLVKMLMDFCGPDRTLVMPAFFFGDPNIGSTAATFRANPRFDMRRTPSQMGLATELFRRSRGVLQSRHPIYRISALGPLAKELTSGHETAQSALGRGSPFDLMTQHNTLILGIGKPFEVLTHVHHAEAIMGPDFPADGGVGDGIDVTVADGQEEVVVKCRERRLRGRRNMWKLREIMTRETLREWTFHNVPLFATRAHDVTQSIMAAARNGVTIYEGTDET